MNYDESTATALRVEGLRDIQPYVNMVANPTLRAFLTKAFDVAPLYFWQIGASSSGKYHPEWASGDSGLVRHTVLAMYLAEELSRTYSLTETERDFAIVSTGIHDTCKYGVDSVPDVRYFDMHPFLPRSYYGKKTHDLDSMLGAVAYNTVMNAVERHMGSLLKGDWTSVGRIIPETPMEQVVHIADYIASRKKILFTDFI